MRLKSLLLASTLVLAGAFGAHAADAIVEEPAPVVVAPAFTWAGAYIGGQVGYGWGKSEFESFGHIKPDGFLGGLYAGYNFDTGSDFILGIDGDITYNNLKDNDSVTDGLLEAGIESKLRWSGAIRARAGVAFDRFMPYIAGGVAFGSIKTSGYVTDGLNALSASESKTRTGWTIGGGVDYAATDNVILRLEYRYTDFGKKDLDFGVNAGLENKFKSNDIRLGIAYKF
ncbi:outer membrane protein [Brucellaceae bacterium D45D]